MSAALAGRAAEKEEIAGTAAAAEDAAAMVEPEERANSSSLKSEMKVPPRECCCSAGAGCDCWKETGWMLGGAAGLAATEGEAVKGWTALMLDAGEAKGCGAAADDATRDDRNPEAAAFPLLFRC